MPRYKKIYESEASTYDVLVSKEDYQGNILPALDGICSVENKVIVEFGAGTGRLTRLLAQKAKFIHAYDAYPAMLQEGRLRASKLGVENISFTLGENKSLPVSDSSADLTIAGWTFGHCTSWRPNTWKEEIELVIREMKRITRKSGFALILETLGAGHESPETGFGPTISSNLETRRTH